MVNRESVRLLEYAIFPKHVHGAAETLRYIACSIDSRSM